MAYTYHEQFGIDVTILRYFTVYGPAGRSDMSVLRFIKWIDEGTPITIFGDGTQSWDFTYVEDIARGTVAAMRPLGYEIINLGGGKRPRTLQEMIRILESLLGKKAKLDCRPFHSADMKETSADVSKARRLLDWKPTVDLGEGLKESVDWYRSNLDWMQDIEV